MKMYELLSDPSKWTQRAFGRDSYGNSVMDDSKLAICWCMMGALCKCYELEERSRVRDKIEETLGSPKDDGFNSIIEWNDQEERTFEEVQSLLLELDI